MPQFVRAATTAEMAGLAAKLVEVAGRQIALFRVEDTYYAIDDTCTHKGGPLSEGVLEGTQVTCPWHGARFDVCSGAVEGPPAKTGVKSYAVRVTGEDIEVEV